MTIKHLIYIKIYKYPASCIVYAVYINLKVLVKGSHPVFRLESELIDSIIKNQLPFK